MNMKKYFELGMITLLESKYIDDITVGELIAEVGSCKGTFYKHYIDKYDLCCSCFKSHIFCGVQSDAADWIEYSKQMIDAFGEHSRVIMHAFESSDCNSARHNFEDDMLQFINKEYVKNGGDTAQVVNKMAMEFCCKSVTDIMMRWIGGGKKEPKEFVLELINAVIPQSVYTYLN